MPNPENILPHKMQKGQTLNPNGRKATILEKTIANAMRKSLEKGSLYSIETLLSRVYGKPKESVDMDIQGEVTVTMNLNPTQP
jgi:hypothetical protein